MKQKEKDLELDNKIQFIKNDVISLMELAKKIKKEEDKQKVKEQPESIDWESDEPIEGIDYPMKNKNKQKEKDLKLEQYKKGLYSFIRKHGQVAMTEKIPMDYVKSFVDWAYEEGLKEGRGKALQEVFDKLKDGVSEYDMMDLKRWLRKELKL